jgi:hypothetical protein
MGRMYKNRTKLTEFFQFVVNHRINDMSFIVVAFHCVCESFVQLSFAGGVHDRFQVSGDCFSPDFIM